MSPAALTNEDISSQSLEPTQCRREVEGFSRAGCCSQDIVSLFSESLNLRVPSCHSHRTTPLTSLSLYTLFSPPFLGFFSQWPCFLTADKTEPLGPPHLFHISRHLRAHAWPSQRRSAELASWCRPSGPPTCARRRRLPTTRGHCPSHPFPRVSAIFPLQG